jgi:DNA-binding transcriptional LysR family regulator
MIDSRREENTRIISPGMPLISNPSALSLARTGVGLALVPGNIIPRHFDGVLLRPDPPVLRPLAVYTRVRPDPITAAFVSAFSVETLVTPPHISERLGLLPT